MNRTPESKNGSIIPYVGIPFPEDFEVCWAGEFTASGPAVPPPLFRINRRKLRFDQEFTH